MCVHHFESQKQTTVTYQIWYECKAFEAQLKLLNFEFLQPVIITERACEIVRWVRFQNHIVQYIEVIYCSISSQYVEN